MSKCLHMELGFMENSRPHTVTVLCERNLFAIHISVLLAESMHYASFLLSCTISEGGTSRGLHVSCPFWIVFIVRGRKMNQTQYESHCVRTPY